MFPLLFFAALVAAGSGYAVLGAWWDRKRYRVPGRIVDIGGCRLHIHSQGSGSPAVILESGIASSSLAWALVQPELARITCVCSYDRAGLGWSDPCRVPRSLKQMTLELNTLLSRAGVEPPLILVGHSFGSLIVRAYAHHYPEKVAGLVFVDPVGIASWANCSAQNKQRLTRGVGLSKRGALLARLGVVRAALDIFASGGRLFPKLIARASAGKGRRTLENLIGEVRKLPPETWPLIRSNWSSSKCFDSMAQHLECLPSSAREAMNMPLPAHLPLVILSAASATKEELAERDSWVAQSSAGRNIRVPGTGHWLHLERPELVIEAVQNMIESLQNVNSR